MFVMQLVVSQGAAWGIPIGISKRELLDVELFERVQLDVTSLLGLNAFSLTPQSLEHEQQKLQENIAS